MNASCVCILSAGGLAATRAGQEAYPTNTAGRMPALLSRQADLLPLRVQVDGGEPMCGNHAILQRRQRGAL